jgi:hypothetical protein
MTYPSVTSINATKGLPEILTYVNTVTNNWISNLLIMAIYVIIAVGFYKAKDDFQGAMAIAGYGTFVVSLFFWIGGFISGVAFGMVIGVAILGTLMLLLDHQ